MVGGGAHVILIAGRYLGDGATTISLATSLMLSEEDETILIDMDAHSPTSSSALMEGLCGAKDVSGLTSSLYGKGDLLKGYLHTGLSNLGFLSLGVGDRALDILEHIKCFYRWLVIDGGIYPMLPRWLIKASNLVTIVCRPPLDGLDARNIRRYMEAEPKSLLILLNAILQGYSLCVEGGSMEGAKSADLEIPKCGDALDPFSAASKDGTFRVAINSYILLIKERIKFLSAPKEDKGLDASALKQRVIYELALDSEARRLVLSDGADARAKEEALKGLASDVLDREGFVVGDREEFLNEVVKDSLGLGPLEDFVADPDVTEIMVIGVDHVYIEKGGRLIKTSARFADERHLRNVIDKIVSPIGRRVDESSPIVDARLPSGERVHIVVPPVALDGAVITIRKFRKDMLSIDDLIAASSLSREMASFLEVCVRQRKNILVAGGTASGKTTLLNILSSFIPAGERIVTIEDSAELNLAKPHVVRLEARAPNVEGEGEISIRDLVRASLRMRPDRIIVGECRGAETLDMLQAMNTGHEGSMTTVHANSSRDALGRLATLSLFAGFDIPLRAVREQIAAAIDVIVFLRRERDGTRRIVDISEVTGMEGEVITMQPLYSFEKGRFVAQFVPTFQGVLE